MGDDLVAIDREAVALGLLLERVGNALLPVDEGAVDVESDPVDLARERHWIGHCAIRPRSDAARSDAYALSRFLRRFSWYARNCRAIPALRIGVKNRAGPRSSPSTTQCTRVAPSPSGVNVQVPSMGCGPSTMWTCRRFGRSNSVNSTICSNSLAPGGFVRSRMRVPSRGGPSVSGSTSVLCTCHVASF